METAQDYTDWNNSEPTVVTTLIDAAREILHPNTEISTTLGKMFQVPERAVLPSLKPLKGNFKLLQMWEGKVVSVDERNHEFTAIVTDKTSKSTPDEMLTMSIEEVPPTDLALLSAGAIFYWSIGYADYPGRPRSRESRIRFRRLPKWQQFEIDKAKHRGKKLAEFFAAC